MSLLSELLTRARLALAKPQSHTGSGALQAQVSKTINDALVAAGLSPHPPSAPPQAEELPAQRPREDRPARGSNRAAKSTSLPGTFVEHSFAHAAGTRRYKLYTPSHYLADAQATSPLLLMLHGCTQSPDDFAAGTRMNELAEQHGFLVAYPAQSAKANHSRCWNWFRPGDQLRAGGEPALLAALAQDIAHHHAVDPTRIYVAGLSAGAAMAVILGATYPDVFAAVGSHSGLPYRAAHDMPSAFAAMGGRAVARAPVENVSAAGLPVTPLIAFQGDCDRTVAASNADTLVRHAIRAADLLSPERRVSTGEGTGRAYTRTTYTTAQGDPLIEFWQIHGAGHAWSGGSPSGSYTDAQGPDASAEMVRFFLQVRRREIRAAA
ncbi:extracellular catalytic domain type 1 short-chain-length polyhydroxyalkanoate depolymerase [Agrilutibacter solisilvae]|uniref:PHB depolymerase family esterase n=1 Tax=Agrilutibacter solisilvae TaxID=2763317 RepID=A0A974Y5Q7_9GAMM|nr:PHB depolymerase family esterase [Lysobacter solisilvae]QSX78931.1 PHB depolymerase family esterase [Lysobacter solisilvae]